MAGSGGVSLTGGPAAPNGNKTSPSRPAPPKARSVPVRAHTRNAPAVRNTSTVTHVLPEGFKVRPHGRAMNPLLDPSQTLSGSSLAAAADALSNVQTAGPITELGKQIAANNAHTRGTINLTGGFYNQLEPFVQSGVDQQGKIASDLKSQLTGIGNDTQSQLQGIGGNAMSSLLKYAPGDNASAATSDLAAQIARQQGLAAQQAGTYRSFGANQSANYGDLGASQLGTYGLQGQEALKGIAQSGTVQNQPLMAKIAGIQASKGALTAANLGKLRQQEVSNGIARAGLGIDQAKIATALRGQNIGLRVAGARNKTALRVAGARNRTTQRGQDINAALGRARIGATLNGQQLAAMRADRTFRLETQKFGAQQARDSYLRAHGLGPYKVATAPGVKLPKVTPTGTPTLTPHEQEKTIGEVSRLPTVISEMQKPLSDAAAKSLQKSGVNVTAGQRLSQGQIRTLLTAGPNPAHATFDPAVVDAGYALAGYGYLTPKQITGLNKLGVIVGNRFRRGNGPAGGYQHNAGPQSNKSAPSAGNVAAAGF